MGAVSTVLITGAAGFIGRAAVAEARKRGLRVIAVVRNTVPVGWDGDEGITLCCCDLTKADAAETLGGYPADAVIHAAGHLGDDAARHASDTLAATQSVLDALGDETNFVLVSSLSVYDCQDLSAGDDVTEATPLEAANSARDAYSEAKVAQEALCASWTGALCILRPGAVYGPRRTWHAHSGVSFGPLHLLIQSDGEVPLVHVEHLAWALVQAAVVGAKGRFNVIDDDLPTRLRFAKAHRQGSGWPKVILPLPWKLWRAIGAVTAPLGSTRPGLLQPRIFKARGLPLRYPNTALRNALGGADQAPFEFMLSKSMEATQ